MIGGNVLSSFVSLVPGVVCSTGLAALPVTRWASIACTFVILNMKIREHGETRKQGKNKFPTVVIQIRSLRSALKTSYKSESENPTLKKQIPTFKKWARFRNVTNENRNVACPPQSCAVPATFMLENSHIP